ncbi:MAG: FG-GAP repeat protein [Planctomycetes bacterium]|nr:FG-GAP repeat protein [Planctomycetota bacterium]
MKLSYILFGCIAFSGAAAAQSTLHTYPGSALGGNFGQSVAIVGDCNHDGFDDIVVGSPNDDTVGINAGKFTVISGKDGSMLSSQFGDKAGDGIGFSVAGIGDVDFDGCADFAVGAPYADPGNNINGGKVKIISGKYGNTLFEIAGQSAGDEFGYSISYAGSQGTENMIIGAPYRNSAGGSGAGSAYLYSVSGAKLFEYAGAQAGQHFGWSVSGGYKTTGSGNFDVLIGSPHYNGAFTDTGRVDIYSTGSTHVHISSHNGSAQGELMGTSVALVDDTNGDFFADYIAGCPGYNNSTGRALVYHGKTEVLANTFAGAAAGDQFGAAVSNCSNSGLNGSSTFAVGAPGAGSGNGYVKTYSFNGILMNTLAGSGGERCGASISGAGNLGGAFATFAIGCPNNSIAAASAGCVRTYSDTFAGAVGAMTVNGLAVGDQRGFVTKVVGDVDGDGIDDLVITSPYAVHYYLYLGIQFHNEFAGRADIISGATGNVIASFNGSNAGDLFGYSAAAAGDCNMDGKIDIIIGAPQTNNTVQTNGYANIYSGAGLSILFTTGSLNANDAFGFAVDGAGDLNGDGFEDVVIGAPKSSYYGSFAGYVGAHSGVNGSFLWDAHAGAAYAQFGYSVAGLKADWTGDNVNDIIVGAPYDTDSNGYKSGAAFLLSGANGNITKVLQRGNKSNAGCGISVCGVGDVDLDGYADAIVGTPWRDSYFGVDTGGATVFSGKNGAGLFDYYGAQFDQLGIALAPAGDIDKDGRADFAAGADQFAFFQQIGNGYIDIVSGYTATPIYHIKGEVLGDRFGAAVGGFAYLNNDPFPEIVAGAPMALPSAPLSGQGKAYIISLAPAGVASYGLGTPGCAGFEHLVTEGAPQIGNNYFGFRANRVPQQSLGLLLITDSQDPIGTDAFGIGVDLLVDFSNAAEIYSFDATSDSTGIGGATTPIPYNPAIVGNKYYAQTLWLETNCNLGGNNTYNLSSSSAVFLTIQVK